MRSHLGRSLLAQGTLRVFLILGLLAYVGPAHAQDPQVQGDLSHRVYLPEIASNVSLRPPTLTPIPPTATPPPCATSTPATTPSPTATASLASIPTATATSSASLTWDNPAPMPEWRMSFAAAGNADGKVYLVGGTGYSSLLATVDVFDPTSNAWTTAPNLPTERWNPSAAGMNGKVYVVGGYTPGTSYYVTVGTADQFDPSSH